MAFWNWLAGVRGGRGGLRRGAQRRAPQGRGIESLEIRNLLSAAGGTGTFDKGISPPSSNGQHAALGDLDRDGDLDVLISRGQQEIAVLFNDGTGRFTQSGQNFAISDVQRVALGDIDGDGDLDAFVARGDRSPEMGLPNEVWLNNGDGTFANSGQQLGSSLSVDVGLIDLDSDGDLDAFVANVEEDHEIWLNDGTGQFSDSGQRLANTRYAYDVEVGDLDNDGDIDAIVVGGSQAMSVWRNDGNASFTQSIQPMAVRNIPAIGVALGDIDNDGDLDAVIGADDFSGNKVLFNNGDAQFTHTGPTFGTLRSNEVALGDLDSDGDLDVLSANDEKNRAYLNDGTGVLVDSGQSLINGGGPSNQNNHDVVLGDLNGDGDLDAFVANGWANQVFLNQNSPPEMTLPAGGGSYELVRSGEDFVLRSAGGEEIDSQRLGAATQLLIRGSDGDDTLTVDFSGGNPIRVGGLTFENSRGDDRLVLVGGSATDVTHRFDGIVTGSEYVDINDGVVNLDGRAIRYIGVDVLVDHLAATNRAFHLGDGNDGVELSDNIFPSDGRSVLHLFGGLMTVNL
ncbi:MAG: VCBS repeat-containing protein, partial [Planctomycetaceae bacterium]|nr:VCBS repeat-containing protein [Planctomycetaceae bacterium]